MRHKATHDGGGMKEEGRGEGLPQHRWDICMKASSAILLCWHCATQDGGGMKGEGRGRHDAAGKEEEGRTQLLGRGVGLGGEDMSVIA